MFGTLFAALLSARGILTLIGLLAIGLLIWFGGPSLELFDWRPLGSASVRAATIIGLFLAVMTVTFVRYWLARRANRRVIRSLMESEGLITTSNDRTLEEIELTRGRFEDALKVLRDTVFAGKRGPSYLFELPWYIIIGPPGAGKTTILRNSGLEFPLAERLGATPVAGIGGTRNCEWWFAEQAVLIDTPSRYTTHDTDAEIDRAAWQGFLGLLVKHRRRRPIDGILVAVSLSDLLQGDENERRRQIASVRSRVQELLKTVAMPVPIYVLVTKCDLVSGFTEFFSDLKDEGCAQIWGKTFALDEPGDRVNDVVVHEMQDLAERLEAKLAMRMHDERNLGRRAMMYMFPKEFLTISSEVAAFIGEVFRSSRFEERPMLRGVYFTSGTQEGRVIDPVSGAVSRNFGPHPVQPNASTRPGKAFFIKRLLTDVIFAEQGLVGRNSRLERKLALVHGGGYIAAVVLAVVALTLCHGAFVRSKARIAETRGAAQAIQARLREIDQPVDFNKVLPTLNAARRLRSATGEESWLAWVDGVGISATPMLAPAARDLYDHILLDRLLPLFGNKLAGRIDALLRTGDETMLDQVKEVFRTYLMLGDPRHFDRGIVEQAARNEIALAFALDTISASELNEHFSRLIELLPKPINGDQKFVIAVGSRLIERPLVEQVYARLLREGMQNARLRPVDLSGMLRSGQLEIARTSAVHVGANAIGPQGPAYSLDAAIIPGIFTRSGFLEFLLPRLPLVVREEQNADWVLAGSPLDAADARQVALKVMDRYVSDYIAIWTNVLGRVRLVKFDDMQRGTEMLRGLAGPQSALQQIISLVRDNTNLPTPADETAAKGDGAAAAVVSAALGNAAWPGTRILEAFRPLAQLAISGTSGQPASIDRIRDLFAGLYAVMANIATAQDPGQAAFQIVQRRIKDPSNDVFATLRADSALRPEPVRTIMNDMARATWSVLIKQANNHVGAVWTRELVPVCQSVIFQRYPFFASATEDVTLKDFSDFFRPGGILDDFLQKYLSPLVVEGRTGLAVATIDGASASFRRDALVQFQRAQQIRKAFFSGSGAAPDVKFSIKPVYLAPNLLRASFVMDGKEIVYRHEAPRSYDLEWPTRTDASTASITLADTDGAEQKIERSGPWALFRLVDASPLSSRGASDRFTIAIGRPEQPNVIYELRAASVSNPFSLSVLRAFRCPDGL